MELQIKSFDTPAIEFNYEELKGEVAEVMKGYENLVYTNETISEAKADRARLRKVIDVIDSRRKEIKNEIMRPYTEFEARLNEIKALIDKPIQLIDKQVKEYEELQKQYKRENIEEYWEEQCDVPEGLTLDKIFNPKWLNVTYSPKQIEEDISTAINRFRADMGVLERVASDFSFEGREKYLQTLDLGQALAEMDRLAEQARRKSEAQERAHIIIDERSKYVEVPISATPTAEEDGGREWVTFRAYINSEEARLLKRFFEDNNIEFTR